MWARREKEWSGPDRTTRNATRKARAAAESTAQTSHTHTHTASRTHQPIDTHTGRDRDREAVDGESTVESSRSGAARRREARRRAEKWMKEIKRSSMCTQVREITSLHFKVVSLHFTHTCTREINCTPQHSTAQHSTGQSQSQFSSRLQIVERSTSHYITCALHDS